MPPPALMDVSRLDFSKVVRDIETIRRANPQRFEMEQLTAIVHLDPEQHLVVGYKDVGHNEFWAAGHLPGYPLMPGVLICEAAAQLCSFYVTHAGLLQGEFLGFGGMDQIRFRSPVRPGDRLVLVAKMVKYHRRQTIFNVQAFVGPTMVFQGDITGVAMRSSDRAGAGEG